MGFWHKPLSSFGLMSLYVRCPRGMVSRYGGCIGAPQLSFVPLPVFKAGVKGFFLLLLMI